jgi:predicted TIM-barrel fold metal-dependent hydrolase
VIVDAHAHVWSLDAAAYPWQPTFGCVPKDAAPPDVLLATMDRVGVQHAILVQPSVYGTDHRVLFETVRDHPDRFLPVGLVDPADPTVAAAAAALVDEGCVGLRVNLSLDLQRAVVQANAPGWVDLEALGVPICVRATAAHHDLVVGILTRQPRLRLVVDHMGLPDDAQSDDAVVRLAELATFEQSRLKIAGFALLSGSPPPYRDLWRVVRAALELFGSARLPWGSDFPAVDPRMGYPGAVEATGSMPFISAMDRDQLMARTSIELWGHPSGRATP